MKKQTNTTTTGQVIRTGKIIYSSIVINASPAKVWAVLMNFDAYPKWNPFIKSITGEPIVGKHITAHLCPPGQKGMTFKPRLLQNRANREFRWIGSLIVPYLFDGEHTFLLDDNGDGTTTFHHFERFRGILVPLIAKMLDVNTLQGFELMNAKLKERVELA
jgi:hypothetical protein